jgi:hypothetical protein
MEGEMARQRGEVSGRNIGWRKLQRGDALLTMLVIRLVVGQRNTAVAGNFSRKIALADLFRVAPK